ncbi:reactive intermediate/imine deaminase [Bacterioplanes sanyensis]|uniref:Reactive intermediate/imine deaminase n=1 Tax=Bacterioplanes sanyensis TaxID=1249553 RepID=A0A222FI00_9GAMM|nr:RidA family protein [Bacterioplanes sanyensis]ASP38687.1 reactive intermediate/imine deaminase [Bacterioplanes sanyensis]
MYQKDVIHTDQAPAAIGPYSQAVRVGNTVYISGQIPLNPKTMEMVTESFEAQAEQVVKNLRAICEAAGGDLNNLVKLTVLLSDMSHFATVNSVMEKYFQAPYPARAAFAVKTLPKDADVEIEGIMAL